MENLQTLVKIVNSQKFNEKIAAMDLETLIENIMEISHISIQLQKEFMKRLRG